MHVLFAVMAKVRGKQGEVRGKNGKISGWGSTGHQMKEHTHGSRMNQGFVYLTRYQFLKKKEHPRGPGRRQTLSQTVSSTQHSI